jgi:hypothetical protein
LNLLAGSHEEDIPVGVVLYDDEGIAGDGYVCLQLKKNILLGTGIEHLQIKKVFKWHV